MPIKKPTTNNKYVRLEYTKGTSDKFYEIFFQNNTTSDEKNYRVFTLHGKRGCNGQVQIKYDGPSLYSANHMYSSWRNQKLTKGYIVTEELTGKKATNRAQSTPALSLHYKAKEVRSDAKEQKIEAELAQDRFCDIEI